VGEIKRAAKVLNAAIRSPNVLTAIGGDPAIPLLDEGNAPSVAVVRATIHLVRGLYYMRDSDMEPVRNELAAAARYAPQWGLIHYHMGRYYEGKRKIPEAAAAYEKAIRLGDENVRVFAGKQLDEISPRKKP
jgi:tetratricopeptide (TPR) repeat protein